MLFATIGFLVGAAIGANLRVWAILPTIGLTCVIFIVAQFIRDIGPDWTFASFGIAVLAMQVGYGFSVATRNFNPAASRGRNAVESHPR